METWAKVLGAEDLYEVSDLGNCRRIKRGKKLTAESAEKAKRYISEGRNNSEIGRELGVSYQTIKMIRDGVTWNGNPKFRIVKPYIGTDFYCYFMLCQNGKYFRQAAHRMIWEAFNGPIPYDLQINHKDLDRANNTLSNLELMTHEENINHALDIYRSEGKSHNNGGRYYDRKKHKKINKVVH